MKLLQKLDSPEGWQHKNYSEFLNTTNSKFKLTKIKEIDRNIMKTQIIKRYFTHKFKVDL